MKPETDGIETACGFDFSLSLLFPPILSPFLLLLDLPILLVLLVLSSLISLFRLVQISSFSLISLCGSSDLILF